jgi:DNA repair exonuclease SbcCD ATPase subunit
MSVVLKKLKFSNMFSYGDNNVLILNEEPICQLVAQNGVGKTTLSLILQELLYNKNIKGIKKADIVNRNLTTKKWNASLDFSVADDEYKVVASRSGAAGEVALYKNGKNISEHKTLDTYKLIADAIGRDFETFSQLTYQSSTDSLEFLKATDTNRKKFLINLFNMTRYLEIGDELKVLSNTKDKELLKKQGELKTVVDFLNTNSLPEKAEYKELPTIDTSLEVLIADLEKQLVLQKSICSAIDKNNLYKQELSSIVFDIALTEPEPFDKIKKARIDEIKVSISKLEANITRDNKSIKSLDLTDICYACKQPIDNRKTKELSIELKATIQESTAEIEVLKAEANSLIKEYNNYIKDSKEFQENKAKIDRFTQLSQLIDKELPTKYPNYSDILDKLEATKSKYKKQTIDYQNIQKYNESVTIRNAKIDGLVDQIRNFKARQELLNNDILNIQEDLDSLAILKKAFSPTGIVAYKLENVTKQLEESINHYLSTLSDGQFQVVFRLSGEKLNIVVINNGDEVAIESLSAGEFSRVQTSVLLAVRGTLSKIGSKNINLLFLDEILGVLDDNGKERLFEVLQEEKDLNVFLISHEYTHPLIPKIEITKKDNISSISS